MTTNTNEFEPFSGYEGFKAGDKVEFILNPNHCWFRMMPMAVATITEADTVDVDNDEHMLVFQDTVSDVYVVINNIPGPWCALIRRVPEDTDTTLEAIGHYLEEGAEVGLPKLMALHEKTAKVLREVADNAIKELTTSFEEAIDTILGSGSIAEDAHRVIGFEKPTLH